MRARGCLAVCYLSLMLTGCPEQPAQEGQTHSASEPGGPSGSAQGYAPEGAIAPNPETIESGNYVPLSRPLFLYVNKNALKKPEAVAFLQYYLSDEGISLINESGYIKLKPETYEEQRKALASAVKEAGTKTEEKLNGQVVVDGSSTVAPITTAVAEEFSKMHSGVRVPVGTSGTGGGFKKFTHGEIDICDASRAIQASEKELCKEKNIDYIELKVAIDGLTVVVNPRNHWVNGLTVAELKKIWEPDSKIQKWSDIRPEFPDTQIKLFGPDTDSGTFDYFTEEVCGKKGASRSDYQQSADDNFLVTGVEGDEYALGYFGYAYFVENQGKLKALAIAP